MSKKSRATTIRLPTTYDDFFNRFDSKSAAVRTAIDFYLQSGDRLDRLESSVRHIESKIDRIVNLLEMGNIDRPSKSNKESEETLLFLAGGLDDF